MIEWRQICKMIIRMTEGNERSLFRFYCHALVWSWRTLEVDKDALVLSPVFLSVYQSKQCVVILFGFSVILVWRGWSSNADRLCVLSAATRLFILSSLRIQLQLFPLIALNCGLHLRDKWKWLIIWPFVFLLKQWCTDFKHIRIVKSAL
jgi:hypothetical protein